VVPRLAQRAPHGRANEGYALIFNVISFVTFGAAVFFILCALACFIAALCFAENQIVENTRRPGLVRVQRRIHAAADGDGNQKQKLDCVPEVANNHPIRLQFFADGRRNGVGPFVEMETE
jgi:hypothetical protein